MLDSTAWGLIAVYWVADSSRVSARESCVFKTRAALVLHARSQPRVATALVQTDKEPQFFVAGFAPQQSVPLGMPQKTSEHFHSGDRDEAKSI